MRSTPPIWKKLRGLLLQRESLSMANFTDRYARVYGDRSVYFLDPPLKSAYFEGGTISYRQLNKLVCRAANMMRELGVRRGDRVLLCLGNRIELVFAEFGAQRIGAVPVPITNMLTVDEIHRLVCRYGSKLLIADRKVLAHKFKNNGNVPALDNWLLVGDGVSGSWSNFDLLMAEAGEQCAPESMEAEDPAIIFFTAGTTGQPKGAVLTHGGLVHSFRRYMTLAALLPTSKTRLALHVMPLTHTGGHQNLLIQMALATPSLVISAFDPARVLDYIERYRINTFVGIPTMYRMLLDAGAEQRDLTSIMLWGGGGGAFSSELVAKFRELSARKKGPITIKAVFITGYGLAETAGQVSITPPFPTSDNCVGWFLPGVQWKLVNPNGSPVTNGEVGELWLKSPGGMQAYWSGKDGPNRVGNEWFRTGDLMKRGRFGLIYYVSRVKEVIRVGGYNVFPAEVEKTLLTHPEIARCVVVGMPHKTKGELPIAGVVLEQDANVTAEEILAWIDDHIAAYRRPRQVVFLDEIPHNLSMKPLRKHVQKQFFADGIQAESRSDRQKDLTLQSAQSKK